MKEKNELNNEKLRMDEINKNSNAYQELGVILSHYQILLQKISVIITINVLVIGLSLTAAKLFSSYYYIISLYYCFSLILNIFFLVPNFMVKKIYYFLIVIKNYLMIRLEILLMMKKLL